jgi:hypothetical protein
MGGGGNRKRLCKSAPSLSALRSRTLRLREADNMRSPFFLFFLSLLSLPLILHFFYFIILTIAVLQYSGFLMERKVERFSFFLAPLRPWIAAFLFSSSVSSRIALSATYWARDLLSTSFNFPKIQATTFSCGVHSWLMNSVIRTANINPEPSSDKVNR